MKNKKEEVFEIVISELDLYIINKVKALRISKGISQYELSKQLNLSAGTIGKIENLRERAKYSVRHLNLLAQALECSPKEFLPAECSEHDFVKITVKVNKEDRKKLNRKDYQGDYYKIVKIKPVKQVDK